MTTMPTRAEYFEKLEPYWSAPTAAIGLRAWEISKVSAETRVCAACGQEFDLDQFWTGSRLSYYCPQDRGRARSRRREIEKEVSTENDEKTHKGRGLLTGIKNKATDTAKGAIAKPVSKAAGKTVSKATGDLLGEEAGQAVGELTEEFVQKAIA